MPSSFSMVITTCADRESAGLIATRLVEERLAACVQMFPIASVYRWEGVVQKAEEWMLFCKIRSSDYAVAEAAIRAEHSYSNPEIIEVSIEKGVPAYLEWIASATGRQ